jgi:flagellar hook-basal body complex protein FliE
MSNIDLGNVGNSLLPDTSALDGGGDTGGINFGDVLKNAVNSVNQVNDGAAAQVNNLIQGGGGDMSNVMVAVEKADVSFQLMMEVRNKIVNAYQDIEKMQF